MTNRLELNWKLDGFVDEQRYYCSETPIDPENLPPPKVILAGDVRSYVDYVGDFGKKYYIRVGAVKDTVEKISEEIEVVFGNVWSPENLTNPAKLWLSSDSVLTDSSSRISQLTDKSGNNFHFTQSNNEYKPLLYKDLQKNHDVVRFDGINDFVSNVSTDAATLFKNISNAFIFCVAKRRGAAENGSIFYAPIGAPSASSRFNLNMQANSVQLSTRRLDTDSTDNLLSSVVSNDYQIIVAIVDYAAGVKKVYSNSILTQKTITTGNTSNTNGHNQTIRIGVASVVEVAGAIDMDVLEIVVSNVEISDSDRLKLEGWAAHKYGLTDNLPIDHPYKTLVPTI